MTLETPVGQLTLLAAGGFITGVYWTGFPDERLTDFRSKNDADETPVLRLAAAQLDEYFRGARKVFDVPLKPAGGAFFQRVWDIMRREITYGTTVSYSALAAMAGKPGAARAVGMANNRNPLPIFIPCHRVLGKSGALTGFRPGLDKKEWLLAHESKNSKP